jgi:hypothetical protein
MSSTNGKLICFGIGLTILIWVIILIIIRNKPVEVDGSASKADSTEMKAFLVFRDKSSFDIWHKDVMFRLGMPKYGRRLATNEIDDKYVLKQYANWKRHLDSSDQRIRCGYDDNLSGDLIDKNAGLKYGFIKASYREIEEMGFIKDRPNIADEQVYNFTIPEMAELANYTKPATGRSWMVYPEYNFEFIIAIYKRAEFRNKYLVDLGSIDNKSRISLYLDKEDYLCFRVIDEQCKAYVVKMCHNLFNKKYQVNCKFAFCPERSYLEVYVNGTPVGIQRFNHRVPFYYYDKNMMFVGANLDGTYCSKMTMYKGNIYVLKENKTIPLFSFDSENVDAMVLSDREIVAYEDSGGPITLSKR